MQAKLLNGLRILSLSVFALAVLAIPCVNAETYPDRPVKLVTQGAAGSGPDVIARIIGDALSRQWRQQVLILNHSGAGGSAAARVAAGAAADGYTLYMPATSAFIVMPEMFPNLPFNLDRDFVRIGLVGEQPMIIAVSSKLGVSTIPELVALTKQKPGQIFYSANARGTLPHLTAERFRAESGADITYVPYPGAAAGLQDLVGGRISVIVEGTSALSGAMRGGLIKWIGIAAPKRLPDYPDLPAVAESVPGFVANGWFVLMAPKGTPDAIVQQVNHDLNAALATEEVQKRFRDVGTFVRAMSPADVDAFVSGEQKTWQPVVRKIGFSKK